MKNSRDTWERNKFDYASQEFESNIARKIQDCSQGSITTAPIGGERRKHDILAWVILKPDGDPVSPQKSIPVSIEVERGTNQPFWGWSVLDCRSK